MCGVALLQILCGVTLASKRLHYQCLGEERDEPEAKFEWEMLFFRLALGVDGRWMNSGRVCFHGSRV